MTDSPTPDQVAERASATMHDADMLPSLWV